MPPNSLCKHHTIHKLTLIENRRSACLPDELMNEPIPVALEYTFTLDSVLLENSIQAGLGGVRLPTTIKDLHEVLTNGGDVVTVQKHFGLLSFRVKGHRSVARAPVAGITNGGVHLLFDLTHGGNPSTTNVVWHGTGASAITPVPVHEPS